MMIARSRWVFLLSSLLLSMAWSFPVPSWAQNSEAEKKEATFYFEIDFERLRQSQLFKGTALESQLIDVFRLGDDETSLADFLSLRGAVSFPDHFQDILQMEFGGVLPLNFYIAMKFNSEEICDVFYENFKQTSREVKEDGRSFLASSEAKNMVIIRRNKTSLELGTKSYLFRDDRKVLSSDLQGLVDRLPNVPAFAVLDSARNKEFLESFGEFLGANLPADFEDYVQMLGKAQWVQLTIDLENSSQMAKLYARGNDENAANELRTLLNQLLALGKQGLAKVVNNAQGQERDLVAVLRNAFDALHATGDGLDVDVVLAEPGGYKKAIKILKFMAKTWKPRRRPPVGKMNDVRQILLAMHNYESAFAKFPFEVDDRKRPLSWRVDLLPFLEEQKLFQSLAVDQGWDDDKNLAAVDKMPACFGKDRASGMTNYVFVRPKNVPLTFADIPDGTSNTIAILELPVGVPWMQSNGKSPQEIIDIFDALPKGHRVIAGFYDGSTAVIDANINREALRNLLDPADGNIPEFDR